MTVRPTLLLINSDAQNRDLMKSALESDYQIVEASGSAEALSQIRQVMPPLVLLDLGGFPHVDGVSEGIAFLRETLQLNPATKVIVVLSCNDRATAMVALESGAYDILQKPVQFDVLQVVLQRAIYLFNLERESRAVQEPVDRREFEDLVGNSEPMQRLFNLIRRVGPADLPVLITGESGTGKELVARAIHRVSGRNEAPFVAINCGAIPETLLESELFGYEKGAFTGAVQQRKGRIESAQGGTLFLDEIGDIPLSLQVKLLRFLQDHEVYRLGGNTKVSVDVRVLAATNVDLKAAINGGRFREDLFYRLGVVVIPIPPLKARGDDISLLANTFLVKFAETHKKVLKGFTAEAIEAMSAHNWPGNVRELENRVMRAVVMTEGKYINAENLGLHDSFSAEREPITLRVARDLREKDLVRFVLEKSNGNVSKAAVELGISRPTLYQLLARYGLRIPKRTDELENQET